MKDVTTVEVVLYTVPLSVRGFLSDTGFELTAVFAGKINVEPMLTYDQLQTIEKLAFLVA